ncbi:MAG: hypothetical protein ACE37K_11530 [Planctomycetota bacterium]
MSRFALRTVACRLDLGLHSDLVAFARREGLSVSSAISELVHRGLIMAADQEDDLDQAWPARPDDPEVIAASMAWSQLAVDPGRTTRFVRPLSDRRGLVLLIDGVRSGARAAVWDRVISEVRMRGYSIAARATAPTFGGYPNAVEVLAIFTEDEEDEANFEAVWADAITVEENA